MTTPDDDLVVRNHLDPDERDLEAAPEDVAEQSRTADPTDNGDQPVIRLSHSHEVSEWDAIEQARVVELEDEDYR
jgi:hypothetical protein